VLSFKQTKAKLLTILTNCCQCWPPSYCGIYDTPCKCETAYPWLYLGKVYRKKVMHSQIKPHHTSAS